MHADAGRREPQPPLRKGEARRTVQFNGKGVVLFELVEPTALFNVH